MSDLKLFINDCKERHPNEFKKFEKEYETFKLGVLLKQARSEAGLTQQQVAERLKTTKSAISRMENHANDIRLSTLERFAAAVGRQLSVALK
ncbi:HTH cro/C1-type domain-containing protein [Candidatus Electrothrix laxa]